MLDSTERVTTGLWRPSRLRQALARLAYPLIWVANRPAGAWFGRALHDLALRCQGIAINFPGNHGLTRGEEAFLARIAPQLQGGVLLDVGANHGFYTEHLRRLAPNARIHAFEPHPRTFARLAARLDQPGVTLVQAALGDSSGTLELFDFAGQDGSTQASLSREAVALYTEAVTSHRIPCTTLDAYLEAQGIGTVDFLKIDTEGHDLHVLKGAARAIAAQRIRVIQLEFIPANIATRVTMRDIFEALPGYAIHRLCLNGALLPLAPYDVKHCEIYVTQNLVALPVR
ncbi:FkbM family methyltransferase [Sediminicoccus sp. BL-A-41-H5]|uniref:FkbM family methyltransferase n=1 Tax=Sediminicoccus sp. BL-A-41-H5 TaxID=3421106 RepID=UPI003D6724F6